MRSNVQLKLACLAASTMLGCFTGVGGRPASELRPTGESVGETGGSEDEGTSETGGPAQPDVPNEPDPCPPGTLGCACDETACDVGLSCELGVCAVRCGDGQLAQQEACDDGNLVDGDGCEHDCSPTRLVEFALGVRHTCVRTESGVVRCWGENLHGQLGRGDTENIACAAASIGVELGEPATAIVAGGLHSCALLESGKIRCWGNNAKGQVGLAGLTVGDTQTPLDAGAVDIGGLALALTAGLRHTCALRLDGGVICWGDNDSGQLGYGLIDGVGGLGNQPIDHGTVALPEPVVELAAGALFSCVLLESGRISCWGRNASGELGVETELPIQPIPTAGFVLTGELHGLSLGARHGCVIASDDVVCWGDNALGQLGVGHMDPVASPHAEAPVQFASTVVEVKAGTEHSCALLDSGQLRCWGGNTWAQLGLGGVTPTAIPTGVSLGELAAGLGVTSSWSRSHVCARTVTDELLCWGSNRWSQLGYGHTDEVSLLMVPAEVGPVPLFSEFAGEACGG